MRDLKAEAKVIASNKEMFQNLLYIQEHINRDTDENTCKIRDAIQLDLNNIVEKMINGGYGKQFPKKKYSTAMFNSRALELWMGNTEKAPKEPEDDSKYSKLMNKYNNLLNEREIEAMPEHVGEIAYLLKEAREKDNLPPGAITPEIKMEAYGYDPAWHKEDYRAAQAMADLCSLREIKELDKEIKDLYKKAR